MPNLYKRNNSKTIHIYIFFKSYGFIFGLGLGFSTSDAELSESSSLEEPVHNIEKIVIMTKITCLPVISIFNNNKKEPYHILLCEVSCLCSSCSSCPCSSSSSSRPLWKDRLRRPDLRPRRPCL